MKGKNDEAGLLYSVLFMHHKETETSRRFAEEKETVHFYFLPAFSSLEDFRRGKILKGGVRGH